MYLLDTNVVSEIAKVADGRADRSVARWQETVLSVDCYLSPVSLMELEIGVLRVERRDSVQGRRLREWLMAQVLPEFGTRILPLDADIAMRCAALHVPDPRPERDAIIAATALVHGLTVVTRNTSDFSHSDVPLLNPWQFDSVREAAASYA